MGWDKKITQKRVHPQHGLTDRWEDRICIHGKQNDEINDQWNQKPRHSEEVIIHLNIQLKKGINKFGQKGYKETYGEILQLHQGK